MILLIDNYDSFVHNIARYFECLGHSTTIYRNDALCIEDIEIMTPTAIIISPGPCTPTEAGISVATIQHFASRIPMLGICLGHQAIAYAFGGRIVRATRPLHGRSSPIEHSSTGLFTALPNPLRVGRYHSLIIERPSLPACFQITALSQPENEIMGIEHHYFPIFGVQFHPESILTEQGGVIIQNFLKNVRD